MVNRWRPFRRKPKVFPPRVKHVVLDLPMRDVEQGVRILVTEDGIDIIPPDRDFMPTMPAFRLSYDPRRDSMKWDIDLAIAYSDGHTSYGDDIGRAVVSEIGVRPAIDYVEVPGSHFDVLDKTHAPFTIRWRPYCRPELADIAGMAGHLTSHIGGIMQDWARAEAFRKAREAQAKKP